MIAGTQGVMGEVEAQLAAARRRIAALEGQCRELHRGIARCKARLARQRADAERFLAERNAAYAALRAIGPLFRCDHCGALAQHPCGTITPCRDCGGTACTVPHGEVFLAAGVDLGPVEFVDETLEDGGARG